MPNCTHWMCRHGFYFRSQWSNETMILWCCLVLSCVNWSIQPLIYQFIWISESFIFLLQLTFVMHPTFHIPCIMYGSTCGKLPATLQTLPWLARWWTMLWQMPSLRWWRIQGIVWYQLGTMIYSWAVSMVASLPQYIEL